MMILPLKIFQDLPFSLIASVVKNSDFLAGIYFIFLKKRPRQNLKVFQYQSLTSLKSLEK